jgi:integrase
MDRRGPTRAMNRTVKERGLPKVTPHDFRRFGSSNITGERIGLPRFIAGQILAHSDGGVTGGHYDLNDYVPQKRQALDAWAKLLRQIVNGEKRPNNVVVMAAKTG